MFYTRKDVSKKEDVITNPEVDESTKGAVKENASGGKRVTVVDISGGINSEATRNKDVNNNSLDNIMVRLTNDKSSGIIEFAQTIKQIAIYNPTTTVIKLGSNRVGTNDYEFVVNANKMVVLPPFNCNRIYYIQETISNGSVNPIIFGYTTPDKSVGISSIT